MFLLQLCLGWQSASVGFCLFAFYFLVFLGPHLWLTEVPRLGVQSDLQLPTCATATDLRHSHSHAGSLTHCVRPRIETTSSQMLVGLVIAEPRRALHFCVLPVSLIRVVFSSCVVVWFYPRVYTSHVKIVKPSFPVCSFLGGGTPAPRKNE